MTDITIPREARSAGADVVRGSEASTWEEVAEETFLAMLKAWPGMINAKPINLSTNDAFEIAVPPAIILPLTQEKTNERT